MRKFYTTGIILKILVFVACYFWDVNMGTTSDKNTVRKVLRSEQIQPIPYRIKNELSYSGDFEHLEAGIASLLGKFDIKGASVAVAKEGRLIYAKGIGYTDMETMEEVEPRHLFRVASVSKLITASTIMKMAEMNLLGIDDPVFGPDGILSDSVYLKYNDSRIEMITIRNLLNHSGGWNRRNSDPMVQHHTIARWLKIDAGSVGVPEIIRYALSKPLHFSPGSRTSYSNLGYAILGEVIESVTGMKYEDYVQEAILSPLGIHEMRIGKKHLEDRFENEVKYYDLADNHRFSPLDNRRVPMAYGGNDIETLAAAGGWIASPVEILKLVVAIDSATNVDHLLTPESISLMTDTNLSGGHPLGWAGTDGNGNWWRTGSLAGTSALVMRQNDGISWAVFFNSSAQRKTSLSREITLEMKAALNKFEEWPDHDLFYHFDSPPLLYPYLAELH